MPYLNIWIVAKPFTDRKARLSGLNIYQRNTFLSLTKAFVEGFGEKWERKKYILEYDSKKQTDITFEGEPEWLEKQKKTIEEEMFKVIMEDKYTRMRDRARKLMPFKKRISDAELEKSANYDKFVTGLALFNITFIMSIEDEKKPLL